jgi:hypothetical protein
MRTWCRNAAVVAVIAGLGLAGCASSSKPPAVASLSGTSAHGSGPTTTVPKGSATDLLNQWTACIRQHGVADMANPVIDTNGGIHITVPPGDNQTFQTAQTACMSLLSAASTALGGNRAGSRPDPAKLLAFSECMRSHGIPDFPDPSSGGLRIRVSPGSDLNPNSPTFMAASKTCAKSTGVPGFGGTPQPGSIEITGGGPPGGPGGPGGPGAPAGPSAGSGAGPGG